MLSQTDRRALQSVGAQFFVNGSVVGSFLPRLPEIRDNIDTDLGTLGLVFTLSSLGGLLRTALCSPFVERYGSKRAMIVGGVCLIGALLLIGAARSPGVLLVALMLMLVFDVLADVGMNMQGSAISARRSVPVMNRLHGLWSLGTLLGALVASAFAGAEIDLQLHLVGVAVALTATMLFVAPGLLPEEQVRQSAAPTIDSDGNVLVPASNLNAYAVFGLLGAMAFMMEQSSGDWAALRLTDDLGRTAGLAALGFVAYTIGMTAGRFGGDSLLGLIGQHRLIRTGAAINALGLALAFLIDTVPTTLGGLALAGIGNSVMFPMLYDEAARSPGKAAAGIGALIAGSRIGALVAPVAIGTMAGSDTFSVGQAVAIVTIPCAIVVLAVRSAQARRRRVELTSA